jgi:hypothetical protein
MSAPLNQAMLLGRDHALSKGELERHADDGVRTFLAAYGTRKARAAKRRPLRRSDVDDLQPGVTVVRPQPGVADDAHR